MEWPERFVFGSGVAWGPAPWAMVRFGIPVGKARAISGRRRLASLGLAAGRML